MGRRKYWDILLHVMDHAKAPALTRCPAATAGYQLFRQQALAEGIVQGNQNPANTLPPEDRFDLVVSCVAYDARNSTLLNCLHTTGIINIEQEWKQLFAGRQAKARFKMFTHQQWVDWVRHNQPHGQVKDWLNYVATRYGY